MDLDDFAIANEVLGRLATDTGERISFDDMCAAAGVDPDSFELD